MTDKTATSFDQLDKMLAYGNIGQAEYDVLCSALESSSQVPSSGTGTTEPKVLTTCWAKRRLGGVCGGLGNRFGVYPIVFKILFVAFGFLSFATAAVVYLLLYFLLPCDEREAAQMPGFPWGFVTMVGLLLLLNALWVARVPTMGSVLADWDATELPRYFRYSFALIHALDHQPVLWIAALAMAAVLVGFAWLLNSRGVARLVFTGFVFLLLVFPPVGCQYFLLTHMVQIAAHSDR